MDPSKILTGSLVFNVALDPSMVQNDEKFLKTAVLFETFLNEGGVQFQVNHVSRETLLQAEKNARKLRLVARARKRFFRVLHKALPRTQKRNFKTDGTFRLSKIQRGNPICTEKYSIFNIAL